MSARALVRAGPRSPVLNAVRNAVRNAIRDAVRSAVRGAVWGAVDRRAAALVEFAIVAPVLITTLFGVGEIALAIFSAMQTVTATQSLADLGTQAPALQATDMANIYNAAYAIMRPLPSTNLVLRITNVVSNGSGSAFVYWSCGQGILPALAASSTYTSTPGGTAAGTLLILSPGSSNGYTYAGTNTSFVLVEANYSFVPVTNIILKSNKSTTTEAVAFPRLSTYVGFPWAGVVGVYPRTPTTSTNTGSLTFAANGSTITCNYKY